MYGLIVGGCVLVFWSFGSWLLRAGWAYAPPSPFRFVPETNTMSTVAYLKPVISAGGYQAHRYGILTLLPQGSALLSLNGLIRKG